MNLMSLWAKNLMDKNMNKRFLLTLILCITVSGCSTYGLFDFNAIRSSFYQGAIKSQVDAQFGPYRIGGIGGKFSGPMEINDRGTLLGKEIVAWWYYGTEDQQFTYYYARSKPQNGVIAPSRYFWNSWRYFAYMSFGPMFLYEQTLPNKEDATFIETWPSRINVYQWGQKDVFYYRVLKKRVRPRAVKLDFNTVQGIEITQEQYEALNQRCGKPLYEVRCFIDENFVELTPKQLEYVKARKHPKDDVRMSDDHPDTTYEPKRRWFY